MRGRRLEPWMRELRTGASLPLEPTVSEIREAHVTGIVWLRFIPFRMDSPVVVRRLEAMEMLALVAFTNVALCTSVLQMIWPDAACVWLEEVFPNGQNFQFGCELRFDKPKVFSEWFKRFVLTDTTHNATQRYRRIRTTLETTFKSPSHFPVTRPEQLVVPVRAAIAETVNSDGLFELAKLASMQCTLEPPPANPMRSWNRSRLFRFTEVEFSKGSFSLSHEDMCHLNQLWSCGVRAPTVRLYGISFDQNSADLYTTVLQRFVAPQLQMIHGGGGTIAVEVDFTTQQQGIPGVFSALLVSQVVRKVAITVNWCRHGRPDTISDDKSRLFCQWAALAVFSSQATNHIDHLAISMNALNATDIETIRELLREFDPLSFVMELGSRPSRASMVSASAMRLTPPWQQDQSEQNEQVLFQSDPLVVHVVDDSRDDWIGVLLPGWGLAWVERTHAQAVEQDAFQKARHLLSSTTAVVSRTVKTLEFVGLELPSVPFALTLLRVIGRGVTDLRLREFDYAGPINPEPAILSKENVDELFEICPQLDALQIGSPVRLDSWMVIARGYETGSCHMHLLDLANVKAVDQPDELGFLLLFANKDHAMASQVTSLKMVVEDPMNDVSTIHGAIQQVLTMNHVLHTVQLDIRYNMSNPTAREEFKPNRFKQYSGEPVKGRRGLLALSSKLAFLSVCSGRQQPPGRKQSKSRRVRDPQKGTRDVMGTLDSAVLSQIFQFAANGKKRRVEVKFSGIQQLHVLPADAVW